MKSRLNLMLGTWALFGVLAAPALAQSTPAETNLDPAAAQMETRNARGDQLTDVSPEQARANALQRCDRLPDFYKTDCIARVEGGGEVAGSIVGGGQFKESITTMPAAELQDELKRSQAVQLPAPTPPASTD